MRNNKELLSLIIGLGNIVYTMGHVIFFCGLILYWFIDPIFSIYLMLVGIGLIFLTGQKVKNIHLIGVIRRRGRRKRPSEQEER